MRLVVLWIVALFVLPSVASVVPRAGAPGPAASASAIATLNDLADRLAPLDHGAMRARVADLPQVGVLRTSVPTSAPQATMESSDAAASPASVGAGQWVWWNDSTYALGSGFSIAEGGHLIVQRSIVNLAATALTVYGGATLVLENSTLRATSGTTPALHVAGTLDGWNVTFDHVGGYWPAEHVILEASRFVGGDAGPRIDSSDALVRTTLFMNYTGAALSLGPGAAADADTFVNNGVGVDLLGDSASLTGSVLRFNVLGVAWDEGSGVTVSGNDIYDNFQDGLYGTATSTLDASGNWWDGAPNVEGDSFGGAGVSVSSYANARVAAANDRAADAPFAFHSLKSVGAWPLGAGPLDGPVIARAGTLTVTSSVDMNGYRLGSHSGSTLKLQTGADVRGALDILSRGSDTFDGAVIRGPGNGIVSIANSPTVQNDQFISLASAYQHVTRSATDTSLPITVKNSVFDDVENAITAISAQATFQGNTIRGATQGILTTLSQTTLDTNVITSATIGIVSALDTGFTMSSSSVYDSQLAFVIGGTPSPTIGSYEGRFNLVDVIDLGSSFTLSASNVYDNGAWALYAEPIRTTDPVSGQPVTLAAQITVDPTTFIDGSTRGNVVYAIPRFSSPSSVIGASPPAGARVATSGQTMTLSGTLTGPVFARNGSTLSIGQVDGAGHVVGAAPTSHVRAQGARVANATAIAVRASDAQLDDITVANATYAGLILLQTTAGLQNGTFRNAPLVLWDAPGVVKHSLFVSDPGVILYNDTTPRAVPRVEESWFEGGGWGILGVGNPPAMIVNASFATPNAIDDTGFALNGVSTGDARIDASASWRQSGASLRGPVDAPTRTSSWRAAFDASPTSITDLDTVSFTDRSFDLDSATRSWNWSFGDGSYSTTRSPTHAFATFGNVTVKLTTKDSANRSSNATRSLRIMATPITHVDAPASLLTLTAATINATASTDADGAIAAWRFQTSDGADSGWSSAPTYAHAFAHAGTYTASVRARDNEGNVGLPASATIVATNRAPTATIQAPPVGSLASPTQFKAIASDADGNVQAIAWDFGDGATATGANVTHQYSALGDVIVTLTVTDDQGAAATSTRALTVVANVPPTTNFSVSGPGSDGATYAFADKSVDPDGNVTAWLWEFGDGSTSHARNPQHRFVDAGWRTVRLTATDDLGQNASFERVIAVDDVLAADMWIDYEPFADHATIHIFTHWINGTAQRASWMATVRYSALGIAPSTTALTASGETDEAGSATVELGSSFPFLLPGHYGVTGTAWTTSGFGGNTESATLSAVLDVSLT